jgi:flagellar basal-body rod modification protein FlgD
MPSSFSYLPPMRSVETDQEALMNITEAIGARNSSTTALSDATKKVLDKDDFLKLLLTQLRFQDAMDPVKDKDFIAQMAQFSSLEQTTNLVKSFEKVASRSQNNEALAMLGTVVSGVQLSSGEHVEGLVTSLKYVNGDPELSVAVGEGRIKVMKLSEITEVGIVV